MDRRDCEEHAQVEESWSERTFLRRIFGQERVSIQSKVWIETLSRLPSNLRGDKKVLSRVLVSTILGPMDMFRILSFGN